MRCRNHISETLSNRLKVISRFPIYGQNYKKGYQGFIFTNNDIIASGITYFTRFERLADIKVHHSFTVSGENECIQAHATTGVQRAPLAPMFDDPSTQVFFRKPIGWTEDIGTRIATTVATQVGCRYDTGLIAAHLASGTFIGRMLDRAFNGKPERFLTGILDHPDKWICSELNAFGLDSQPEYHNKGILADPNCTITPQELFNCESIFAPWILEDL